MRLPPAVGHTGRAKWAEVTVDLMLAAAGGGLILLAVAQAPRPGPVGLWLLVGYTAFAVGATLVLACVGALTSQLPTTQEVAVDGDPAVVVRTWAAPWWYGAALDLGLAVVGLALAGAGVAAGGELALLAAVPGLVAAWFGVRVALVLLGRRRRPALWLTRDEVVLDSSAGRARADRGSVRRVRSRGRRLVVELDHEATWQLCPRPWRAAVPARDILVLDCSATGHRADDLAAWLEGSTAASTAPSVWSPRAAGRTGAAMWSRDHLTHDLGTHPKE